MDQQKLVISQTEQQKKGSLRKNANAALAREAEGVHPNGSQNQSSIAQESGRFFQENQKKLHDLKVKGGKKKISKNKGRHKKKNVEVK
jgi:hypothetical protein